MINIAKPVITEDEKKAVMDVLDSGMLSSGAVTTEFEKEFAAYMHSQNCITTTNGTNALETADRAIGLKAGDMVITTPFSFIASTNSIVYTGAKPVFADIDPRTFNIDPKKIEEALEENPGAKALQIVHLYGNPCSMDAIMALVEKYHVILIEDCAQAHGAMWHGKHVGTFGKAGCFSFYPTKNMTTGEGGAVLTDDADIADLSRLIINHGMETRYYHDMIGYNFRMTNIAAAIGLCQLKKLDGFNQKRIRNAAYYTKNISNPLVEKPYVEEGAHAVFHQYTLKIALGRREDFIRHLQSHGIGYSIFYPVSIPEQRCYHEFNFKTDYPVTDLIKQQVISIPVHPSLSQDDLDQVVETVNSFK